MYKRQVLIVLVDSMRKPHYPHPTCVDYVLYHAYLCLWRHIPGYSLPGIPASLLGRSIGTDIGCADDVLMMLGRRTVSWFEAKASNQAIHIYRYVEQIDQTDQEL